LEADFGLQLFVRHHARGLALTQAGRQLRAKAAQILAEAEAMNRLAGEVAGNVRGALSIGCLLTFAQILVPRLRRGFEDAHPQVTIRQFEMNQQQIFDGLRAGEIDVALSYDLAIPDDLVFQPLVSLPPYVLFPEDHPLADLSEVTPAELHQHPMVLLDLPLSADYFLSFFRLAGLKPLIAERTRDMAVMRSLVANGYGYSIANIRPLDDRAPDGRRLRYAALRGPVPPMTLGVVMAKAAETALTVASFVAHCKAAVTEASVPGLAMPMP
jgi:DNA-binding transcriptional LysR family regulator